MDKKIIQYIRKARKIVAELTGLALELGTLIMIIKMIIESIQ